MKLVITTLITLDGVMQAPGAPDEDRRGGFAHGGWVVPFLDEDMIRLMSERFRRAAAFLLGRGTFEIFATHWPKVTDPNDVIAACLNARPKHVVSTTLKQAEWSGSTIISRDVVREVERLKAQPGGELQVHGSPVLAQTLISNGLVDEYRLWTYPVVLGSGRRLFTEPGAPFQLKGTESHRTSTGVEVRSYVPAGPLQVGAFGLETE